MLNGVLEEALQLAKHMQQLRRPAFRERQKILRTLEKQMKEKHYLQVHDAMGMLDMSPSDMGVKTDSIHAKLETLGDRGHEQTSNYTDSYSRPFHKLPFGHMKRLKDEEEGSFINYSIMGRPYRVSDHPAWDRIIQLVVAILPRTLS